MPSRYDALNPRTELEQHIAEDLRQALAPRGCEVRHNGTETAPAAGGRADIEVLDRANGRLLLVEVTKRRGSQADGEFPAIGEHLDRAVAAGGYDDYGLLYVSPETSARMSVNIRDLYNRTREREGVRGRIVALDFAGLQLLLDRLAGSDPSMYPASRLGALLAGWDQAVDDARARLLVQQTWLTEDFGLSVDLEEDALRLDAEREATLKRELLQVEDRLRNHGITGNDANSTLVYLTFLRLYEERRQRRTGSVNRFTAAGFTGWRKSLLQQVRVRDAGRLVAVLLGELAADEELREAGLLQQGTEQQLLHHALTDDVVEALVLPVFDRYDFQSGRVDVLGAVFETLARRSEKDTRVGQFFTPQTVVDFCADLVEVRPTDVVLDPAVGTGRFLIAAMSRMLDDADEVDRPQREAERVIREELLLGADIDRWVSTIAQMNMFIHGDGKSGIATVNGLALADRAAFPRRPAGLAEAVDVVLTNPPLGDADFTVAAEAWRRLPPAHGASADADVAGFYDALCVVPMETVEQQKLDRTETQLADIEQEVRELEATPPEARGPMALRNAYRRRSGAQDRARMLRDALRSGGERRPRGRAMKGGALFLGAVRQYLRPVRLPNARVEWRGGRAAVVVDEAVLNTPEYADVRAFLRRHFFVKAVISLSRESFEYLAHTTAKTSVLYLVRKPSPELEQREPTFYAHAERVGFDAGGRWVGDDLPQVLVTYRHFRSAVEATYRGAHLDTVTADEAARALPGYGATFFVERSPSGGGRLDYFHVRARHLARLLPSRPGQSRTLGGLVQVREPEQPDTSPLGEYDFAQITRLTGRVVPRGRVRTKYPARDLWVVREGDVVVSGIDLVNGAVAVAGKDVDGQVLSKEMFAYRVRPGAPLLAEYLVVLIRTNAARTLLEGLTTGTSNRTRLESAQQLLELPVPALPSPDEQREAADRLLGAHALLARASAGLDELRAEAEGVWTELATQPSPEPLEATPLVPGSLR